MRCGGCACPPCARCRSPLRRKDQATRLNDNDLTSSVRARDVSATCHVPCNGTPNRSRARIYSVFEFESTRDIYPANRTEQNAVELHTVQFTVHMYPVLPTLRCAHSAHTRRTGLVQRFMLLPFSPPDRTPKTIQLFCAITCYCTCGAHSSAPAAPAPHSSSRGVLLEWDPESSG